MVYLVDLKARMKEPLCHSTIVCNNQKSLGIRIESPDRIETYRKMRQEIQYCSASPIIVRRREIAARLVEEDIILFFLRRYVYTIHGDRVPCRVILRAELGHNSAVHRNAPRANDLLCRTT